MPKLQREDFTIGWICALSIEVSACRLMLDEEYSASGFEPPLEATANSASDSNVYVLGRIGKHQIVIACLPKGIYGTTAAANTASNLLRTFTSVRFGVLVGIGGGAPSEEHDIRLGDVVVGTPDGTSGGVIQYDFGKAKINGFQRTGLLRGPPARLLKALAILQSNHELGRSQLSQHLSTVLKPFVKPRAVDNLYDADYAHPDGAGRSCSQCDESRLVDRVARDLETPSVHYGVIASGNQVIKDAQLRDALRDEHRILCFEMEAAGIVNDFPCVVVRGICDYCDSHKNKIWQPYAAVVAAAWTKDFLSIVDPITVSSSPLALELAQSVETKLQAALAPIQNDLDLERHKTILQWLSAIDHQKQLTDTKSQVQPGTGQWLLNHVDFKRWVKGEVKNLLCPGIPGAGKTCLAALIIDYLLKMRETDSRIGVLFMFCSYKRHEEQKLDVIVSGFLRQLCNASNPVPASVQKLFERHSPKSLEFNEMDEVLNTIAGNFTRLFIVIDALDENIEDQQNVQWIELSSWISQFQIEHDGVVQFLATSRPDSKWLSRARSAHMSIAEIQIRANDGDIRDYLRPRLCEILCIQNDIDFHRLIEAEIIEASDGMFLLARLQLDSIRNKTTKHAIRTRLSKLCRGSDALREAYTDSLERISNQPPEHFVLAKSVLLWVLHSKEVLKVWQLRQALSIEPGDRAFDEDKLPVLEQMLSVCAGLVTFQKENSVVVPSHKTVSEYFKDFKPDWLKDAHTLISTVCLTCRRIQEFNDTDGENLLDAGEESVRARRSRKMERWDDVCDDLPLTKRMFRYAVRFWGYHASFVQETVEEHVIDFLRDRESRRHIYLEDLAAYDKYNTMKTTGLHLLASFGLDQILSLYLRKFPEGRTNLIAVNRLGQTPMAVAANKGQTKLCKVFLDFGVDVNARFGMALNEACTGGHLGTVDFLLTNGADPNTWKSHTRYISRQAHPREIDAEIRAVFEASDLLVQARAIGGERNARLLLDAGVDLDDFDGDINALHIAGRAHAGQPIRMLATALDTNGNARDECVIPLSIACAAGHENIARLLVEAGADINATCSSGATAIELACHRDYQRMVQLLAMRTELNCNHATALVEVALQSSTGSVQILLERGFDVNGKDKFGFTPLQAALLGEERGVERETPGYSAIVNEKEKRLDHCVRCVEIGYACPHRRQIPDQRRLDTVQLLLNNGADIDEYVMELALQRDPKVTEMLQAYRTRAHHQKRQEARSGSPVLPEKKRQRI